MKYKLNHKYQKYNNAMIRAYRKLLRKAYGIAEKDKRVSIYTYRPAGKTVKADVHLRENDYCVYLTGFKCFLKDKTINSNGKKLKISYDYTTGVEFIINNNMYEGFCAFYDTDDYQSLDEFLNDIDDKRDKKILRLDATKMTSGEYHKAVRREFLLSEIMKALFLQYSEFDMEDNLPDYFSKYIRTTDFPPMARGIIKDTKLTTQEVLDRIIAYDDEEIEKICKYKNLYAEARMMARHYRKIISKEKCMPAKDRRIRNRYRKTFYTFQKYFDNGLSSDIIKGNEIDSCKRPVFKCRFMSGGKEHFMKIAMGEKTGIKFSIIEKVDDETDIIQQSIDIKPNGKIAVSRYINRTKNEILQNGISLNVVATGKYPDDNVVDIFNKMNRIHEVSIKPGETYAREYKNMIYQTQLFKDFFEQYREFAEFIDGSWECCDRMKEVSR